MLVACVFIHRFAFRIEQLARQLPADAAVLIFATSTSRKEVFDTSPKLRAIAPGTPLQAALSRYPDAVQIESDPSLYQHHFERVLSSLEQVSPIVEASALGSAYLALDGLASMYGGAEGMLTVLTEAVPAALEPRFGIGHGKFPATIAAFAAKPGEVFTAPSDLREFLAPYPLRVLPISYNARARMERLGLKTLADIQRQSVGPMQAHFGKQGKLIWEMAWGLDRRPLVSRRHDLAVMVTNEFQNATVSLEVILLAIEHLLNKAFLNKEVKGRYARLAVIDMRLYQRGPWHRRITFKEPVGSPASALQRIKQALSLVPPPGPVEEISLALSHFIGEAGRQASLFTEVRKRDRLSEEIAQLEARLGKRVPIYQVRDAEPWSTIPERRQVLVYVR